MSHRLQLETRKTPRNWQLHKKGYIPMSGQLVDATLVHAPKQRNTDGEKEAVKEIWPDHPNKAAQQNTIARWTLKAGGKVRCRLDGTPLPQIALPVFGYKSRISIDRKFGFIRGSTVTSAADVDERQLRHVLRKDNTASDVWPDSAYRSQSNKPWPSVTTQFQRSNHWVFAGLLQLIDTEPIFRYVLTRRYP